MNKQLKFTYDDVDYTLEFTRRTVEMMERNGFQISEIAEKPMTMLPTLFQGAFLSRHRSVKRDKINEIYSKMSNKQDLISKLVEMYNEPIATLLEDDENEGNVDWTTCW